MKRDDAFIDQVRRRSGAIENHVIDELLAGRLDRRGLLRHGATLGLGLPLLNALAGAAGLEMIAPRPARAGTPGGTIRVATVVPSGAVDPLTVDDRALVLLQQTGEFLAVSGIDLVLRPALAESWQPNEDGSVWTFKLRRGVKFNNGRAMTADDVVATFDRLADPKNASNALSAFRGTLSKDGTKKVDDATVAFHLDAPNGNFPYLASSDNYNAIILPADYAGDFEKTFIGTGPFVLDKYIPKVSISFRRNPDYWGPKALPDRTEFVFYIDTPPKVLALQSRQVDVVDQIPVQGGQGVLHDPEIRIIGMKSSAHEQVHMRTDIAPFTDKRVRRAMALCLDRSKLAKGLFQGRASLGNDSPFAPVFPSTDSSVAQRQQDLREARQLLEAAGLAKGFGVKLITEQYLEIPQYAVLIQNAAKRIGVAIDLTVENQTAYYGKAVFGQSDWLDSTMGITDYGHRGVPNVFLSAPLKSDGTWNSAHFKNKDYDSLVGQYVAAVDLGSQRAIAGKIQRLLLDETPVIFGYFYDYLTAVRKNVTGVQPNAIGQLFLSQASLG